MLSELKCEEVWRELSNYIGGDVRPELRVLLERHLEQCAGCTTILNGTRNIVRLAGDERFTAVPKGFGTRLYKKLTAQMQANKAGKEAAREILLGITEDRVALGTHLIYFWQTRAEFERGVRFLELGLSEDEHCVLFGHDEAIRDVLDALRLRGYDADRARQEEQLTILRRSSGAQETLATIEAAFVAALRAGAKTIRYLGNLGMGQAPLPGGGADDIVELESGATILAQQYPCIIVCMYDVNTLSGQLVMNGGFHTHPLAVCGHSLQRNPYYSGPAETLPPSRHVN
jgi:hypothetical protein